MYKQSLLGISLLFTSLAANASIIGAVGDFLKLLLKGERAATEVAVEARSAGKAVDAAQDLSKATASKSVDVSLGTQSLPQSVGGSAEKTVDMQPKFSSTISAKSMKDVEIYEALRQKAKGGDSGAMLKMSEMTMSGRINDPGEPYYGYWLFLAMRSVQQLGNSMTTVKKKAQDVCKNETNMRRTSGLFDTECSALDGRRYFLGTEKSPPLLEKLQNKQAESKK